MSMLRRLSRWLQTPVRRWKVALGPDGPDLDHLVRHGRAPEEVRLRCVFGQHDYRYVQLTYEGDYELRCNDCEELV